MTEYRNNHYVPQWYQRGFIPEEAKQKELFLLDLHPEKFRTPNGLLRTRPAVRRKPTSECFAVDDLYTTQIQGVPSRDLEREFFGDVDRRGKRAAEFFARYDFTDLYRNALEDLMLFVSTQKLRTPKGLDWLAGQVGARGRREVLRYLTRLRSLYGAIWAECVWEIADAGNSPTKLIVSDHPVTVFNRACAPGNPIYCRGPNEPDIRLHGTHTIFPLSAERLLVLTNQLWACNPVRSPTEMRPNPHLFRGAMFNFLDVHLGRQLAEEEVQTINWIIKSRAYRYVAAGRKDWLFPERAVRPTWREIGNSHLLMPDPRELTPGSQTILAYADGSTEAMDSQGRLPDDPAYTHEIANADEWEGFERWCATYESIVGPEPRGAPWDRRPAANRSEPAVGPDTKTGR